MCKIFLNYISPLLNHSISNNAASYSFKRCLPNTGRKLETAKNNNIFPALNMMDYNLSQTKGPQILYPMKTGLNIPFNRFDERLTTLHEFMLLSFVSTIIMCSNEVSWLLEADVHLADAANCPSPPVYVCVSKWMCVCANTQNTRQAKIPKKARSDPIWLQAICLCQEKW